MGIECDVLYEEIRKLMAWALLEISVDEEGMVVVFAVGYVENLFPAQS